MIDFATLRVRRQGWFYEKGFCSLSLLAHIATSCPKLKALHVGNEIVPMDWEREEGHPVTEAGVDHFVRRCTQLQHLSLYCVHRAAKLPEAFYHLTHLHTLALTDGSDLEAPDFLRLASLAALSLDTNPLDDPIPWSLLHLTTLTSLFCCNETRLFLREREQGSDAFSFEQLRFLKVLEFDSVSPRFDLIGLSSDTATWAILPSLKDLELHVAGEAEELPPSLAFCPNLRTLTIQSAGRMQALPDDMGWTLQQLRHLHIQKAEELTGLPELKKLDLGGCGQLEGLPEDLTELKMLHSLDVLGCDNVLDDEGHIQNVDVHDMYMVFVSCS
ncbi:unnamed protein product [Closterium sp. NIES-64]|nr:unnamed protein product [Closterium sp. NIES-64]